MADEIQKLRTDIALNKVLIVIGAHASIYTTNSEQEVAHWKGLIKHGIWQCFLLRHLSSTEFERFNEKLDSKTAEMGDYLFAAGHIKYSLKEESKKTNEDHYKLWLAETVGRLVPKNPELICAIGELECPILTTNYDSLLADLLNRPPLTWNKYCTDTNDNLLEYVNNSILHLHGYFKEPDSVIFSSGDYKQIHQNKYGLSKLRTLLKNKTLLFIGYDSGIADPHFPNLLNWISEATSGESPTIYKLVRSNQTSDHSLLENITTIQYGNTSEDLLSFIRSFKSFIPIIRHGLLSADRRERIRTKYLTYLIKEYGHVLIFGYSNGNINLPLESVYVELKFDPTHPSIKAMQTLEINEEFKRKFLSHGFLTKNERNKIIRAVKQRNTFDSETMYRDFMVDQWLTVFLSDQNLFAEDEVAAIKNKILLLKQTVMEKNSFQNARQYQIQQAYQEFKHFIILGHPGSGKTTLSKWLVINMAKECLGEENTLFNGRCSIEKKIPVLIPIWKYVDQSKQTNNQQKRTLLQFIMENSTCNSSFFDDEERRELSLLMMESFIQGNVLVIFEGLDEVPAHIDRSDLMKEMNTLLERGITYDTNSHQLSYSIYEQKEINNIEDPNTGNRFIITSRIEGNYFEDINFYIPRLTIENMSNDALKLFCHSYMECIRKTSSEAGRTEKQYESDQLYKDISQNKDIFQLAINPQLASVIATIYNQCQGQLPERRIDLYEIGIETTINRLTVPTDHLSTTMLWSILQEIAEYLHSKVEGLSEKVLKEIIRKCLIDQQQQQSSDIDDLILNLVNTFKYQAGLLSEFGQNSFRFIHRTFQEYLAAKSMIFSNGIERSEDQIYENIISKVGIPNWRVPLSMTLGILSKSTQYSGSFIAIITRLLTNDSASSNTQFSTYLVPFIIIDSLNDISFSIQEIEYQLIRKLADLLLIDYQNMSGFARLREHQELIHSYFLKLKEKYTETMTEWLIEKINDSKNLASCAHIALQLKWYEPKFHQIFLSNLHCDCIIWNWPIDTLLRFYSNEITQKAVLKFKNALQQNPKLVEHIKGHQDWLCLVTALYGGYRNDNMPKTISAYYEISQFFSLSDKQKVPFLFYYQEIWGKEDPINKMIEYRDTVLYKVHWTVKPVFDQAAIYKESFLTDEILQLLVEEKSAMELTEAFRTQIDRTELSINHRIEALIALVTLGDFDLINTIIHNAERTFLRCFANRIEQLICILKDSIAKWSSILAKYLLAVYVDMKVNDDPSKYDVNFINYCKIYISLMVNSGGLPINTTTLAETMENIEDKCDLYAEYWTSKLTGASNDFGRAISIVVNEWKDIGKSNQIIKSLLKMSDTTQLYKPVRSYAWPLDTFTFPSSDENDIPIAFFNCLENINTNLISTTETIWDVFIKNGYSKRNRELIPLVVLFNGSIMSKDYNSSRINADLMPKLNWKINRQEVLYTKIQSMSDPYYKSRGMYQLAEVCDEKSDQFLTESLTLATSITQPVLKFEVLEKIFSVVHYKDAQRTSFIQQIVDQLVLTWNTIEGLYNRVIASIRLSFYGSGQFRYNYLTHALQNLMQMDQDYEQIKLIIKLKPLISLYDDLHITLNQFIESLKNKTHQHLVNGHYGKILSTQPLPIHISDSVQNRDKESEDYTQLQALFLLFAQLNDVKSMIDERDTIDQLWTNLFKDPHNQSYVSKILEIGLKNELFLTPQVAIILDELVRQEKEDCIAVLFPYIIKPSHEVLPVVQRWFTDCHNKSIRSLAALLLTEAKYIFESAVDIIIDLLQSDNDSMRYRAQRVFQHPERDVKKPSKRISVIGERTLMKICQNTQKKEHSLRVLAYLNSFFYDVLWDDPQVFQNLHEKCIQLEENNSSSEGKICFFDKIYFIDEAVWSALMQILKSSQHPSYVEKAFHSILALTQHNLITADNWNEFRRILAATDTSQFKEQLYFTHKDLQRLQHVLNEICALTNTYDEISMEILESKVISELSSNIETISQSTIDRIKHIGSCSFYVSREFNQAVLNILNTVSINALNMENLMNWLIHKIVSYLTIGDTRFSMQMCDCLLSLAGACAQKDDYLYRKITNSPQFNKIQMSKILEKILIKHPCFTARGSAFILLAALDRTDHKMVINAMNTLFDENLVKKYMMIGIPLIHLSPNEFLDDLLESLKNDSAVKAYEILKIFTQFALNEQIDVNGKSKIINYLANEIGQLKSKKPINYYYTDIIIPFTTTLENELYKAWIKIQGLSGKTQYSLTFRTSSANL